MAGQGMAGQGREGGSRVATRPVARPRCQECGEPLGAAPGSFDRAAGGQALRHEPALLEVVVVGEDQVVDMQREQRIRSAGGGRFES